MWIHAHVRGKLCLENSPAGIRAYVQYGDSVSVLAGLLSTYGAVSTMHIHVLLGSLLGVSLSTGTITSMVSKCAQKVGNTLETIKSMLIGAKVANFDETGTDVNGKTIWVHSSSTQELTYICIANYYECCSRSAMTPKRLAGVKY